MDKTRLLLLAAIACAAPFQPDYGTWGFTNLEYTQDDCKLAGAFPAETLAAAVFEMNELSDGFTMENALLDEPLTCALDGFEYTCSTVLDVDAAEWPEGSENTGAPEATTSYDVVISGLFEFTTEASFDFAATATCAGADCEAYYAELGVSDGCMTAVAATLIHEGDQ